ncbi:MAG TPA: CapA family protein [Longimicrobiales bacterium]
MENRQSLTLFLCGDVMTGRGIDQVLPHPSAPELYETVVRSALEYVELAEQANGPTPRPVDYAYVWGAALDVLDAVRPDARIVNLETSITADGVPERKDVHYRMHPANVSVLTAAGIDVCVLANNHVLDWGEAGLLDTLAALERAGIRVAGAGRDRRAARAPAVIRTATDRRVLVFGLGTPDSGIPGDWAAGPGRAGVLLLPDFSDRSVRGVARMVAGVKEPGDVAIASIHWGANWGYAVPREHRDFARALLDRAGIDIVHGHSSHHPKAIEVYRGRPIFYGCGDFLNDYEGIGGYEEFRGDLVLMYFVTIDRTTGRLRRLRMTPLRIRNFRLEPASPSERAWLQRTLDRECRRFRHRVVERDGALALESL